MDHTQTQSRDSAVDEMSRSIIRSCSEALKRVGKPENMLPIKMLEWASLKVNKYASQSSNVTGTVASINNTHTQVASYAIDQWADQWRDHQKWQWTGAVVGHDWLATACCVDRKTLEIRIAFANEIVSAVWYPGHELCQFPHVYSTTCGHATISCGKIRHINTVYSKRPYRLAYYADNILISDTRLVCSLNPGRIIRLIGDIAIFRRPLSSLRWEYHPLFNRVGQYRDPLVMITCAVISLVSMSHLWWKPIETG